ncbi:30S ribosomal protein S1 [Candidatus Johnevansia muelleri]|uniref:30S ribosomal protein S1 n=1 Tax=Candidatus Johnevansia muelleri TaxID=1495769 RepID=A0A078KEY5_9GAMM|nr:30S ribosomal protein S1 [Candidatus Evansia muelleri]
MKYYFYKLFKKSLKKNNLTNGTLIKGVIINITNNYVIVNAYLKSEGKIPLTQFKDEKENFKLDIGKQINVTIENLENGLGETLLSREKAKHIEAWNDLKSAYYTGEIIKGMISHKVKGGFTVDLYFIRAFLPGSLLDIRPLQNISHLENKELNFKVIKIDNIRNNAVVSRRAVLEIEKNLIRDKLFSNMLEGQILKGFIKNITKYGAFIDLGGVDGLLHITDILWKHIKHPSEVLIIGDEIFVKILKFDRDRHRVYLGLKQLIFNPWFQITNKYKQGSITYVKIINITNYGCFGELKKGVEGLIHFSNIKIKKKYINFLKLFKLNDIVQVLIINLDEKRHRISFGLKLKLFNPWLKFISTYKIGDCVLGYIKSLTDFGIFIALNNSIDGLIHISDISWFKPIEIMKTYKKGFEIKSMIIFIDFKKERIYLGLKQIDIDPISFYLSNIDKTTVVTGYIKEINKKEIIVELAKNVIGTIKTFYYKNLKNKYLHINDKILANVINFNSLLNIINLCFFNPKKNIKQKKTNKLKLFFENKI